MAQATEAKERAAVQQPLRLSRVFHARRDTVFKAWSSGDGTVNLFGRGHQAPGHGKSVAYIVSATLEISAQTRNVCILAALCSAAVT